MVKSLQSSTMPWGMQKSCIIFPHFTSPEIKCDNVPSKEVIRNFYYYNAEKGEPEINNCKDTALTYIRGRNVL